MGWVVGQELQVNEKQERTKENTGVMEVQLVLTEAKKFSEVLTVEHCFTLTVMETRHI